jgi:hypothetical protein
MNGLNVKQSLLISQKGRYMTKVSLVLLRRLPNAAMILALLLVMSGCASVSKGNLTAEQIDRCHRLGSKLPSLHYLIDYNSDLFKGFTPRPVPAKVADEDDAALVHGGYYKLGELVIASTTAWHRFNDIFATEAAKRGADAFRRTSSKPQLVVDEETKSGVVPTHLELNPSGVGTRVVPEHTVTVTRVVGGDYYEIKATIWRYDPQGVDK